jgi:hypothetical protein
MQLPSLFSGGGSGGGAFLAEGTGMKPPIDPHDSVGILLYYYVSVLILLYLMKPPIDPHDLVGILLFLPSYHYISVLILLYMRPHAQDAVGILEYIYIYIYMYIV